MSRAVAGPAPPLDPPTGGGVDPGVSSYLDLLRAAAALAVLLSHYLPPLFGVRADVSFGSDAVIAFFVISGFVITHVGYGRDRPAARFFVNRLARLWSVLLPSIALSALAAVLVGQRTVADGAPAITGPLAFAAASLKTLLFVGENWGLSSPAPFNAPVWSLNFEAWYYLLFGVFVFAPPRMRWGLCGALAFLAGPPILALLPCWLVGVWVYRHHRTLHLRAGSATLLFFGCVGVFGTLSWFRFTPLTRCWLSGLTAGESYHLGPATGALGDMVAALLVGGSIVAVANMAGVNRMFVRLRPLTRRLASRTLSLYLYHMPTFAILYGWAGIGRRGGGGAVVCLCLGICLAVLLGSITESRLGWWRAELTGLYGRAMRPRVLRVETGDAAAPPRLSLMHRLRRKAT